ncbi:MAG: ABC transporter ATP-binding protein [Bacillota bacterium]|nr:ABC transporter ATP-binding protein [Bacillota bacterium]REJ35350.1 MAG: ABC transporter ATP-binding protein [Bacillota bacterium]
MVEAIELRKVFRVAKDRPGVLGALRGLFSREGREIRAVDGISFSIGRGEFVGYLGPNGAGKSTTIKMLAGILHPTSGEVRVDGLSPQRSRKEVVRRLGVVFGQRTQAWWDLPVRDTLELLAAMYGVKPAEYRATLKRFDELLEIGAILDVPVRKLSLGQRMRADLVAAWLHRPPVVFLDEPTIGLDAVAKRRIREFLREVNRQEGTTILLTTHDMDDIEELCSRVMVINHGRLVYDGDVEGMRRAVGAPSRMRVEFAAPPQGPLVGPWTAAAQAGPAVTVAFDRSRCTAAEVIAALSRYGQIRDIYMEEPDIEQVIERLYGQPGAAAGPLSALSSGGR